MAAHVQGIGIGLRRDLAQEMSETSRKLDLIEVMPENWICFGGKRQRQLLRCLERFPAVTHSISLNIGGVDPLSNQLLDGLASFCEQHNVEFWSDHVCFSSALGKPTFDLLPLPFTRQVIQHTAAEVTPDKERYRRRQVCADDGVEHTPRRPKEKAARQRQQHRGEERQGTDRIEGDIRQRR